MQINICRKLEKILRELNEDLIEKTKTEEGKLFSNYVLGKSLESLNRLVYDYKRENFCAFSARNVPSLALKYGADKVTVRIIKGPLSFVTYDISDSEALDLDFYIPLNCTDGKRNLWEITVCSAL